MESQHERELHSNQLPETPLEDGLQEVTTAEKIRAMSSEIETVFTKIAKDELPKEVTLHFMSEESKIPYENLQELYDGFLIKSNSLDGPIRKIRKRFHDSKKVRRSVISTASQITIIIGVFAGLIPLFQFVDQYSKQNKIARKESIQAAWKALDLDDESRQAGFGRAEALQLLAAEGIPLDGIQLNGINLNLLDLSPSNIESSSFENTHLLSPKAISSFLRSIFISSNSRLESKDLDEKCENRFADRDSETGDRSTPARSLPICVHLQRAKFRGSQLQATNFSHSNLIQADFRPYPASTETLPLGGRTNLTHATLVKADLRNANFSRAILTKANLTGARFFWPDASDQESVVSDASEPGSMPESAVEEATESREPEPSLSPPIAENEESVDETVVTTAEETNTSLAEMPTAMNADSRNNNAQLGQPELKQNGTDQSNEASSSGITEVQNEEAIEPSSGTKLDGAEISYVNLTDIIIEGDKQGFLDALVSAENEVGSWQFAIYSDKLRRSPQLCGNVMFLIRESAEPDAEVIGHIPSTASSDNKAYGEFTRQEFEAHIQDIKKSTLTGPDDNLLLECYSFVNFANPVGRELFYKEMGRNVLFKGSTFNDLDLSSIKNCVGNESNTGLSFTLESVSFQSSKFFSTKFCGVYLKDVGFTQSDLSGINFSYAILEDVRMLNVKAYETEKLIRSNLKNVTFEEADFGSSDFTRSQLNDVVILNSDFGEVSFFGVGFTDVVFQGEPEKMPGIPLNLYGANFQKAKFKDTAFRNAYLSRADFRGATFEDNTKFESSDLTTSKFEGSVIQNLKIRDVDLTDASFSRARLRNIFLTNVRLENASFEGAEIETIRFLGQVLGPFKFHQARITDAVFTGGVEGLGGADFSETQLKDVDFRNASLVKTDFGESTMFQVDFRGADLRRANFSGAQLNRVKLNDQTLLLYANFRNIQIDDEAIEEFISQKLIAGDDIDNPDTEAVEDDWKYVVYDDALRQRPELCGKVGFLVHEDANPEAPVLSHLPGFKAAGKSVDDPGYITKEIFQNYLDQMKVAGRVNLQCFSFESFTDSDFFTDYQNLSGFELNKSNLQNLDFSGTNFSGADLRRANLRGANLSGANLQYANLRCADLSSVTGLEIDQIQQADFEFAIFSDAFRRELEAVNEISLPSQAELNDECE